MQKTPCQYMRWNGLPAIRKKLAETLITQYGLNQRQAAEKLGMTPAAICLYLSEKRGGHELFDVTIMQEITTSVDRLMNNHDADSIKETCRICQLVQQKVLVYKHRQREEIRE